jgi:hypothetical protein
MCTVDDAALAELGELLHQTLGEVGAGGVSSAELTLIEALEVLDQVEVVVEPVELPAPALDGLRPLELDGPADWSAAAPAPAPVPALDLDDLGAFDRLAAARDQLRETGALDPTLAHWAAAALDLVLQRLGRQEEVALRREGRRERDRLIPAHPSSDLIS